MTTRVYFIRHAQSDRSFHDERTRPLTPEGMADTEKIIPVLKDKGITRIISSPYTRTIQTVEKLSKALELEIVTDDDLRERNAGKWHGDRFFDFVERQWADFNYSIEDGESLRQVQERNIRALKKYLDKYNGQTLAIATHGTALSTIINYYFPKYGFKNFLKIADLMPMVLSSNFSGNDRCLSVKEIFSIKKTYK